MIAKHDAREADSRKAYEETIHALKAESESKRKTYEDAHEAESESEQKAYKDAILTHSEHILYMQGVVIKAETKLSTVRLAKKKCLLHFENLLQSERQERILLECQIKAHQIQYDQDMRSQRKAHLCEMEAQVKCIQNSEREARESERKVHLEEQLKSSQDAERESQVHLREMEAQLKCIRDSERKAHADLDSERKAHHNALMAMQSAHTLRQEACRDNFQGLLRSERLEHNEHVTKFLASFESIIKDERALHFETQRLLESESETRMNE
jgi:hypothetical protein